MIETARNRCYRTMYLIDVKPETTCTPRTGNVGSPLTSSDDPRCISLRSLGPLTHFPRYPLYTQFARDLWALKRPPPLGPLKHPTFRRWRYVTWRTAQTGTPGWMWGTDRLERAWSDYGGRQFTQFAEGTPTIVLRRAQEVDNSFSS